MSVWFRIAFEHALTHCVSSDLVAPLVYEMAVRQHPIKNFERKYGREHAEALGGNPVTTAEWAFDLGGGTFVNEPRETFSVDGLELTVSCDHFAIVLDEIRKLPLRKFEDGTPYYKTKFWLHATVMTPTQRDLTIHQMGARAGTARDRAEAFTEALRNRRIS